MMLAPLEGWRHVKVTGRHAAVDYAQALKDLSGIHFPGAAKIVLVQDNLGTHTTASLYAAFPATQARRARRAVRMALHAQAWKLARLILSLPKDGRVRTRRPLNPVPGSPYPQQTKTDRGNCRLAGQSKQNSRQSRLAIHNPRRPCQTQKAIPIFLNDSGH
jgi:hypothetical protein